MKIKGTRWAAGLEQISKPFRTKTSSVVVYKNGFICANKPSISNRSKTSTRGRKVKITLAEHA